MKDRKIFYDWLEKSSCNTIHIIDRDIILQITNIFLNVTDSKRIYFVVMYSKWHHLSFCYIVGSVMLFTSCIFENSFIGESNNCVNKNKIKWSYV